MVVAAREYCVLGIRIRATDPARTVAEIHRHIETAQRSYVIFANVHGVMEARSDATTRAAFNGSGFTVPDGMPLVWMGRLQGHRDVRRVYGPDLALLLFATAARVGWSCFFYGGGAGVAADLASAMAERFPGLRVAGVQSPPFRPLSPEEDAHDVGRINASGASIVFVGLGCPKQERWMAEHRSRLSAPVLLGVGAAFDFHTGRVRQAPRWMMRAGLEWLFRLSQEPRRLWRRYLLYNPLFVVLGAAQLLGLTPPPDPD